MTLEVTFECISRVYLLFAKLKQYHLQVQLTPSNTPISINYLPRLGPLVQWLTPCHYQFPHVFTFSLNQQIFQDLIHKTSSPSSLFPIIALIWRNFKLGWIQFFVHFIHMHKYLNWLSKNSYKGCADWTHFIFMISNIKWMLGFHHCQQSFHIFLIILLSLPQRKKLLFHISSVLHHF